MREILTKQVISELEKNSFRVASFSNSKSCFDIVAKRDDSCFLIKLLGNIDGLRWSSANELKKLSETLNAIPVIIGEKTKVFSLEEKIIYERYNLPVFTFNTFCKLLNNSIPKVKYFKGKTSVELDSEKMKKILNESKKTEEEFAKYIGISKDELSHIIKNNFRTTIEIGAQIEDKLNKDLIKEFDITKKISYSYEKNTMNDPILGKFKELGLEVSLFDHSPFNALSNIKTHLFIQKSPRQNVEKKAMQIRNIKDLFNSKSVIITKEFKYTNVNSTPIIIEDELKTISKKKELDKLIKEREIE